MLPSDLSTEMDQKTSAMLTVSSLADLPIEGKIGFGQITLAGPLAERLATIRAQAAEMAERTAYVYVLRIFLDYQTVVAYQDDGSGTYTIPVRSMACSTGHADGTTPTGTYYPAASGIGWI